MRQMAVLRIKSIQRLLKTVQYKLGMLQDLPKRMITILHVVAIVVASRTADTFVMTDSLPLPNEMGSVMILMYHEIGKTESIWSRKLTSFRNDLETLYTLNYRPVSLKELVQNEISTPKGFTPIVLTFDDGTKGQFRVIIENGQKAIDPKSAVGILEAFGEVHPDFPIKATFFLHGRTPFYQPDLVAFKLNYLVEHGYDIGNHSTHHQNLARADMQSATRIQRALGNQSIFLRNMLGLHHPEYQIDTLALCYGARPKVARLWPYLVAGISRGEQYRHIAILNVGAGPSFSPAHKRFDALSLPRIRASDKLHGVAKGIHHWIDYFNRNPQERYVSDGDVATLTLPRAQHGNLNARLPGNKRIIIL